MDGIWFKVVVWIAFVAMGLLFYGGIRALQNHNIPKLKAWLMIAVSIITALNLYLWITMPPLPVTPT